VSTPLHGPLQAATSALAADVERVQAATRRLLLVLLELDDADLDAPAADGLGTRRHVLARCVLHSDAAARSLGLDVPPSSIETLRHGAVVDAVDAVTTSLGTAIAALTSLPPGSGLHAAVTVAHDHVAWLELTMRDLAIEQHVDAEPSTAVAV